MLGATLTGADLIDEGGLLYNTTVLKERMDKMFQYISEDITTHDYREVTLADLGDDVEGAGLRVSQLLRIAESMTKQAKEYSEYLKDRLRWLADEHPDVQFKVVHVEEDNHGQLRLNGTKRNELPDNVQELITHDIAEFFKTAHEFRKYVNVEYISAGEVLVDYDGYKVVFSHTDSIQSHR